LKTFTTSRKYDDGFEFGFSAIGDTLTVFANRKPIAQMRDSTYKEGQLGMGTWQGAALFRDVEVQILKK